MDALKTASEGKTIRLGAPRDRPKVRSGVVAPVKKPAVEEEEEEESMVNLDSDDE